MDAADFYTGIVPDVYSALRGHSFATDRYQAFVEEWGAPVLELGCGDDGPFFDLARAGFDIDGVDSSKDMVKRATARLKSEGLSNRVYRQRMEKLDLERTFGSIYLAGPTFNLLVDDDDALDALLGISRHLNSDGAALVPLFTPQPTDPALLNVEQTADIDGATARYVVESEEYDEKNRTRTTFVRYELDRDGKTSVERREWILHWYHEDDFRELARRAGLDVTFVATGPHDVDAILTPAD